MNVKVYSLIMLLATILAWLGFFMVIRSFDPNQANFSVFALFYGSLFVSILGSLALLGLGVRKIWHRKAMAARLIVTESFRQACILSIVLVIALWLQGYRVLTWWNIGLLVVAATTLEFLIIIFRQQSNPE